MKKKQQTPRSKVKDALRRLWLRSRERATALKKTSYCCERCGVKQSKAKGKEVSIEVHHIDKIDWEGVVDLIFERLLHHPDKLMPLCKKCHGEEHEKD
jgi:predicted HNH restriction endonuclease